jgi:hypothetical protein
VGSGDGASNGSGLVGVAHTLKSASVG